MTTTTGVSKWKKIGEMLIEKGAISEEQVVFCLEIQKRTKERFGKIAVTAGFVSEEDLMISLSEQNLMVYYSKPIQMDMVDKEKYNYIISSLPSLRMKIDDLSFIPIKTIDEDGNPLSLILTADPLDSNCQKIADKLQVAAYVYLPSKIRILIEQMRSIDFDIEKIINAATVDISAGQITTLIEFIINKAILANVSDIHIEPSYSTVNVRFRIDGVLETQLSISKTRMENIGNVLLNLAKKDSSDAKFKCVDGAFSHDFAGVKRDIRFSSVPSIYGASIVMRILHESGASKLGDLQFDAQTEKIIREILTMPNGIILITGPTGSGKSTTLYSFLREMNTTKVKILTVEDPVEIKLPGITQVQVQSEGIGFSDSVRAFLRQDPDIILIGEVRDYETLREAFRAANTGHLVLTTLHANSAIESLVRLVDIGLQPFMVSSIIAIMGQRLVRKLCTCKKTLTFGEIVDGQCEEQMSNAYQRYRNIFDSDDKISFAGKCPKCNDGYRGRIPLLEVLLLDKEIRQSVMENKMNVDSLLRTASAGNFISLREKAITFIKKGVTSVDEASRIVKLAEIY